jgi:pectinesterase
VNPNPSFVTWRHVNEPARQLQFSIYISRRRFNFIFGFHQKMKRFFLLGLYALISFSLNLKAQTNLFVAADGSAQFKTVQAAIMAVPSGSNVNPVIIHIAPGTYKELIYVQREKSFFKLVGENPTNTVLSFNLYAGITNAEGKPIGTFKTPSTTIDADNFTAENLTFENSAGAVGQALAIRVDGDRTTFRNCRFLGWQDTILLNRGRQYFENCYIAGHVDFIFGAATAWFENCHINCLGTGYVTAASTPVDQPFGFVFSNCKITGENPGVKTYLGRPWRIYASTIYLNCEMSDVVRPEGWFDWKKPEAHKTARYAEFGSYGVGGSPTNRPDWTKQLTKTEAEKITVEKVLGGTDGWKPNFNPAFSANRLNIQYGKAGGEKLLLDAHVPAGDGKFPVVIIVHGGGWSTGDKETDIVPVFAPFATNFTWFTINYRLAPTNRWPACYDDVQTAIRWVKKHAAEFKGDPNRIALLGYSAGGHLVTLAATLAKKDTRVQAIVGFAPPTDLVTDAQRRGSLDKWSSMKGLLGGASLDDATLKQLGKMSPLNHVKPGLSPFLLIQGDMDKAVAHDLTVNFQAKLQTANVNCELITITNGTHRIADWGKFDPAWQDKLIAWLNEKLPPTTR